MGANGVENRGGKRHDWMADSFPVMVLARNEHDFRTFLNINGLQSKRYKYLRNIESVRGYPFKRVVLGLEGWSMNPVYTDTFMDVLLSREPEIRAVKLYPNRRNEQ